MPFNLIHVWGLKTDFEFWGFPPLAGFVLFNVSTPCHAS